jgi:ubiquinone/menaquinone biosynthesis C-methylase UbiE
MNSLFSNSQENFDNNPEKEFEYFLLQKAEAKGFNESKKQGWVNYMMDTSRAERTVKSIISDLKIHNTEKYKVLDIGSGFGSLVLVLSKYFNSVCGVEIEEDRVEWTKKRTPTAEVICASATQLPWSDGEFDLIMSTDVFEHITYEQQQMVASEMMRVLKLGGQAYLEVPNRFQILDEHNRVWFGTWLPDNIREKYVNIVSKNRSYVQCWERTGDGWKNLFETQGFKVTIKPHYLKGLTFLKWFFIPANRYKLYLQKREN